jgi:hypothetical protein
VPGARAAGARQRRLLAGAAAAVAAPREHHVPAHRAHGPLPLADRARTRRRALDARAPAPAARLAPRHRQRTLAAGKTLGKRDRRLLVQVGPARGGRPPGAVLDQDFGHEIAERRRVVRPPGREVEPFEPAAPRLGRRRGLPGVIAHTALPVDQRFVRLEHLLEVRGGRLIAGVDVGMELACKTTVGPPDLGLTGILPHAEHHVEVHVQRWSSSPP